MPATAPIAADGSGWQETLQELSIRHQTDDAPNDVHYLGLLEPAATLSEYCAESCVGGIAYVTGAELFNRHSRVAMALSYGDRRAAESFGHELGHALGATHAPCGGGADEDEAFPYAGGRTGWWGLEYPDVLHDPSSSTDIMGYCPARWVSDYTYRRFAERVSFLGASLAVLGGNPIARWRVVLTGPRGPRWGRSPSAAIEAIGERETAHVLDRNGRFIAEVGVYRAVMDFARSSSVMVPEPRPGWHGIAIEGERPIAY